MKMITHIKTLLVGGAMALAVSALATPAFAQAKKPAPKPYPLDKCIVSDEKLGEMGKPYVFIHEGREIKLCCKPCLKGFKKDPAKHIKKLEAAEKAAKK